MCRLVFLVLILSLIYLHFLALTSTINIFHFLNTCEKTDVEKVNISIKNDQKR